MKFIKCGLVFWSEWLILIWTNLQFARISGQSLSCKEPHGKRGETGQLRGGEGKSVPTPTLLLLLSQRTFFSLSINSRGSDISPHRKDITNLAIHSLPSTNSTQHLLRLCEMKTLPYRWWHQAPYTMHLHQPLFSHGHQQALSLRNLYNGLSGPHSNLLY